MFRQFLKNKKLLSCYGYGDLTRLWQLNDKGGEMLDFALEEFPRRVALENELMCIVRPLHEEDEEVLCDFMLGLEQQDRLFIKESCSKADTFTEWCHGVDYECNLPLLALEDKRIVALGILHQRQGGWKRHIGSLNLMVDPAYGQHGLVLLLIGSLVALGRHAGLMKLESELMGARPGFVEAFQCAGFDELSRVPDYVEDMRGRSHDFVLMGIDLIPNEEFAGVGD